MNENKANIDKDENYALNKFFEDIVNDSIKKLSQMNLLKDPMKFKLNVEFGEDGPQFGYMARATNDLARQKENTTMLVDIIDKGKNLTVLAEVPTSEQDIEVGASKFMLFIKMRSITKNIKLPKEINASKAEAHINNNVLEVNLPIGTTKRKTKINIVGHNAKKSS